MGKISKSYNTDSPVTLGQMVLLVGVVCLMTWVSGTLVGPILDLTIYDPVRRIQIAQILTGLLVFMVPPMVIVAYQKVQRQKPFIHLVQPSITLSDLGLTLLLVLLAQPVCVFFTWVMGLLPAPAMLQALETDIAATTKLLITSRGSLDIALALLAICVIAPVAEEYFFRGAIQGWMLAKSKSIHLSVGLVAVLFGVIHLEWSGVLPRIFLGLILGYTAVYRGIPTAICIHVANNLIVYLALLSGWTTLQHPDFSPIEIILYSIASVACIWITIRIFNRLKNQTDL